MNLAWWQWLLAVLGGLIVIVILMYAIGAALPVSHTASVSARIDGSPEQVWALITDPAAFPDWRSEVQSVEVLTDESAALSWRESTDMGALTFETEACDPPHRMTARIADKGLPLGGSWTYEVTPDGDGAVLTITENGEVYAPLFRLMSRFVFGHESTIRGYLEAVQLRFRGGPPVTRWA